MDERLYAQLAARLAHEAVVVATVVETAGATPRKRGARMLVGADTTAFSIGGGLAEARTIAAARALLGHADATAALVIDLGGGPGAAVAEVEVCGLTGVHKLLRVDLLHDVGDSLAEIIDRGQIEGGFVQGLGWLTCEELRWNAAGRLLTDAPSTYKIPTLGEVPQDFRVALFRRSRAPSTNVIFHSKGVGEPPLMLALSVREALREAIAAFAPLPRAVQLTSPATPEAIFAALTRVSATQPQAVADALDVEG